jgi:outer membrane lipoprotein SlyB
MKNKYIALVGALALTGMTSVTLAQMVMTPKAQLAADSKAAAASYASDKKLCNDEAESSSRLQCRRDAKAEYDKAIASAKAKMAAANKIASVKPVKAAAVVCVECGKVVSVSIVDKEGEGGALGIFAGGAAGALLGHQVGAGTGKDLATIAGAVGGAYAGKKLEEKMKTHKVWSVSVQYADGRQAKFEFEQDPGLKAGDPVKNSGATIVRN